MQPDATLKAWLALSLVRGLGGEAGRSLLKHFGSPENIFSSSRQALSPFIRSELLDKFELGVQDEVVSRALSWLDDPNNHIVTLADVDYPKQLLNISDPPLLLYAKGRLDLLNRSAIAIVGSRHATQQGINNARFFAESLSKAGLSVVSGLAHGIDAAAHHGGLLGPASSIAIVGTGLDKVYPAINRSLAHELASNGVLISEFPLEMPPLASNFPRRNRLISGISLGCLVVEASIQSGSLITARLAVEQGKEVFAIPGSIHSPQSKGCHTLIKQGAKLVETVQDILDELGGFSVSNLSDQSPTTFSTTLLDNIGYDPVDLGTLSVRSGLTVSDLSAMLLSLELEGLISALPGGFFQRLN